MRNIIIYEGMWLNCEYVKRWKIFNIEKIRNLVSSLSKIFKMSFLDCVSAFPIFVKGYMIIIIILFSHLVLLTAGWKPSSFLFTDQSQLLPSLVLVCVGPRLFVLSGNRISNICRPSFHLEPHIRPDSKANQVYFDKWDIYMQA